MDNKNIRCFFILPEECKTESDTTEVMKQAFETCTQSGVEVSWIREEVWNCLEHNKTDVIVFQTFKGKVFEEAKNSKSVRVIGPWCVLICLTEGINIPNFSWPIWKAAMFDCIVTCSSLPKIARKELQEKIQLMGGYYTSDLRATCTHLVTDSVKSEKYIQAAQSGVKIYLKSWVDAVWKTSETINIHCNSSQFNEHRCRAFHKLVVCCTGLSVSERNVLAKTITEHGGEYKHQLHVNSTDILICSGTSVSQSQKFKHARKRNIKCVTMNWVEDSVKNGYAMPEQLYLVRGTSTPTKPDENELPNFSMLSNISCLTNARNELTTVDGTISNLADTTPLKQSGKKRKSASNEHNELIDEIDLKRVKCLGPFLDGCAIYIIGFGVEQREKLYKILNFSGATRYEDLTERITHILVGDSAGHEFKQLVQRGSLDNFTLVNVHWLLESINKGHLEDESLYIISVNSKLMDQPSSPLSKKGLHLLRTNSLISERNSQSHTIQCEPDPDSDMDILQQYLDKASASEEDTLAKLIQNVESFNDKETTLRKENTNQSKIVTNKESTPDATLTSTTTTATTTDDSSQLAEPIYQGLKFIVTDFAHDEAKELKQAIQMMSGKIVSKAFKGTPDYIIVPVVSSKPQWSAKEIVTELWITDCLQKGQICPIDYFHQPVSIRDTSPLDGCVLTLSSYGGNERMFLKKVILKLGGRFQDQLARIKSDESNIVASTHLVSREASGKKYEAAVKWGLPVVNKDWLLECAKTAQRASESPYLIGNSKSSSFFVNPIAENSSKLHKSDVQNALKVLPDINTSSKTPELPHKATPLGDKTNADIMRIETDTPPNRRLLLKKLDFGSGSSDTPPAGLPSGGSNNSGTATPRNKLLKSFNNSDVCSQVTPVRQIMQQARKEDLLGTPSYDLPFLKPWDHVDTPETPLGAFITENPSRSLKKKMVRYLNALPDYKPRRPSTPLSELKRRLWDKICPPRSPEEVPSQPNFDSDSSIERHQDNNDVSTPQQSKANISENFLNEKLQQLQEMVSSSGANQANSRAVRRKSIIPTKAATSKDSQPNTVGWDDSSQPDVPRREAKVPVFMFSGIEQDKRDKLTAELENLGAKVSNLPTYDPHCTHVICPKPARNEKMLCCIAAGKWILHESYIDECIEHRRLINEEAFEYGNPKSQHNPHMQYNRDTEAVLAIHHWREEIAKRGYGPFHDMKAIIVTQKRDAIARIVEAGGGMVVEESPPYSKAIYATHCLVESKSANIADLVALAKQGVYCVQAVYVSEVLQKIKSDVMDHILPPLIEYYKQ